MILFLSVEKIQTKNCVRSMRASSDVYDATCMNGYDEQSSYGRIGIIDQARMKDDSGVDLVFAC